VTDIYSPLPTDNPHLYLLHIITRERNAVISVLVMNNDLTLRAIQPVSFVLVAAILME
jgi:hypothetical protein